MTAAGILPPLLFSVNASGEKSSKKAVFKIFEKL